MQQESGKRYWEIWDDGDVAKNTDDFWVHNEEEYRITVASHIKECFGTNVKITEVGCGTGLICQKLIELGVTDKALYTGGDVSKNMLKLARQRHPEVSFHSWDIFNLAIEDQAHPNVICVNVLQHLPDYKIPLQELIRITKDQLYIVCWFNNTNESVIRLGGSYDNIYSLPGFLQDLNDYCTERKIAELKIHQFSDEIYSVFVKFEQM